MNRMKTRGRAIFLVSAVLTVFSLFAADPVEVQDRVQLADGLFRREMFDLAAKEYESLLSAKGVEGLDIVYFRLGECYRRIGELNRAESSYLSLIGKYPTSAYVARARLQSALIQLNRGGEKSLEQAASSFQKLTESSMPPEVRSAALYHWGETLEKLGRTTEALGKFEELSKNFSTTEYGAFSGLRVAWLLTQTKKPEDLTRALEIYLHLRSTSKEKKIREEATYFSAQLTLMARRYELSAKLFLELRKDFPDSPRIAESSLSAAWANFYAERYKEAVESLDLALQNKNFPRREEALYIKANCLRLMEQRREAVLWYGQQMREFPKGVFAERAWYEQLQTYYRDGDYSNVLHSVSARVQFPDKDVDHVYWMASDAALALGRTDLAVENSRQLVGKCPKSPFVKDALYRSGWLLQKEKAWEAAAQSYLKITELFPSDPIASKALYASGVCHAQLNQRELALRDWTLLLTRYPSSDEAPEALYQKAMEELRGKDLRAAGATLDERILRFPKDRRKADVLYWRGVIYRQLNDLSEAKKSFRACMESHPSKEIEREAVLELGTLLYQSGKKEEAAKFFQQLLDAPVAAKLGVDRLAWLAEFQLMQKEYDAALAAAQTLLSLKPDRGWQQNAWTLLGRVHRAKGERDAAVNAFREALKTGASTTFAAEAALRLGELLTDAGQFDEASRFLEDAASRSASPEMLGMRANAYAALARNAELKGDEESALRFYMSVGILFDDKELVPSSMENAARLLDILGRPDEARSIRDERKSRYPEYIHKSGGKK